MTIYFLFLSFHNESSDYSYVRASTCPEKAESFFNCLIGIFHVNKKM
jgi:hypothetical protein